MGYIIDFLLDIVSMMLSWRYLLILLLIFLAIGVVYEFVLPLFDVSP